MLFRSLHKLPYATQVSYSEICEMQRSRHCPQWHQQGLHSRLLSWSPYTSWISNLSKLKCHLNGLFPTTCSFCVQSAAPDPPTDFWKRHQTDLPLLKWKNRPAMFILVCWTLVLLLWPIWFPLVNLSVSTAEHYSRERRGNGGTGDNYIPHMILQSFSTQAWNRFCHISQKPKGARSTI